MIDLRKTTSTNAEEQLKIKEERDKEKQLNRHTKTGKYRAENNTVRKVIMLGDAGVGKTSIVQRVLTNQFTRNVEPTIGNNTFDFTMAVTSTGKNMVLRIWDISG
jgi:mannitol-specific phosphotransferase system IIBC component